ncbi:hypothetical protein VF14_33760 [Nostoc linckia z18]|uniref:Uncharacterized protein n=2 Tax=Nostoc linckia TaxID=92942 RepID=A0A9Q5Z561_NOSLI|nr:hypothetical protein VF02_36225 [Nostoc linckia z1]PHJ56665.1 hypothetical protein VF05_36895 [Nostoc linckia z3]PHJ57207.1 hypothetical protein VF03_36745 [Nostoc linckia z2]PHJ72088.1 hypothetical protein VF06_36880 [Nostoc linckia z4]PHJ76480.1 hypothetical protein VF07_36755 [Nostoc linckia z6]PHJ87632.1 hypothetical protein VF04_34485 [Nostoc linckia z7]PHJ93981.1 hypothetical protein VF08_34580 [Nostoc linckia z8]PHK01469.1 hypothetical protein VF09_33210 [Nostoc linckia z9]PHK1359
MKINSQKTRHLNRGKAKGERGKGKGERGKAKGKPTLQRASPLKTNIQFKVGFILTRTYAKIT